MAPQIPKGFDGLPPPQLPESYAGFRDWFPDYLRRTLAQGDVRNASSGTGIQVAGTAVTNATISVTEEISSLNGQAFVLAPGSSSTTLSAYRALAAEAGVITLADGGAEQALTIGVATNGIGNAQFRQSAAVSVVGNASGAQADVADITAPGDGAVLQMSGGSLVFAAISAADLGTIANDTVLGNTSGVTAAPSALAMVGPLVATAPVKVPLADTGTFTPTVYGATSAGTTTYVSQLGNYTRIGNLVFVMIRVSWSAATGTGHFMIGELPFTALPEADLDMDYPLTVYVNADEGSISVIQEPIVLQGTTTIQVDTLTIGTGTQTQALPSAGDLFLSGWYPI